MYSKKLMSLKVAPLSKSQRCRYLKKKTIDIIMGPVSEYNLKIAPAFYITQVDLTGPFKAYSKHNKRATLKIWLVVFCCATTTTINIKVMEDYSTTAFIQAFTQGFLKDLLNLFKVFLQSWLSKKALTR